MPDNEQRYYQLVENIPHLFLEILQRYCKLFVLGNLGMSGHANQIQYHQLVGNS